MVVYLLFLILWSVPEMSTGLIECDIGKKLLSRSESLCIAESCSGGLIAHRITNVPGASAYFLGSIVTYSNTAKTRLLGVRESTLAEYGAVSEPVVRQMAEGVLAMFGADWSIAVTGIAGPGGGSRTKPVGTVYLCVANHENSFVECQNFRGTREEIKAQTAERALNMLWERLA